MSITAVNKSFENSLVISSPVEIIETLTLSYILIYLQSLRAKIPISCACILKFLANNKSLTATSEPISLNKNFKNLIIFKNYTVYSDLLLALVKCLLLFLYNP